MWKKYDRIRWFTVAFICLCLCLSGCHSEGTETKGSGRQSELSDIDYSKEASENSVLGTTDNNTEGLTEAKSKAEGDSKAETGSESETVFESETAYESETESEIKEIKQAYILDSFRDYPQADFASLEESAGVIIDEIQDDPFLTEPNISEIRPKLFFNDGVMTERSRNLSFVFPEKTEEETEAFDGMLNTAPITLALCTDHPDLRVLSCDPVDNLAAYTFLMKQIVQADYVSFSCASERVVWPLVMLFLKDEKGANHSFLIDENRYILHCKGIFDLEQERPNYAMITDRSKTKMDSLSLMKCLAIAAYSLNTENAGTRDYFGLNRTIFTEGAYASSLKMDNILNTAFEKAELHAEGRGHSLTIDSAELFKKIMRFFSGELFDENYACECYWRTEKTADFSEEGIRFVLRLKEPQEGEEESVWAEVYLSPQGELWIKKDSFAYMQSMEYGVYQISFQGRFICSPAESYSFDEMLNILGW